MYDVHCFLFGIKFTTTKLITMIITMIIQNDNVNNDDNNVNNNDNNGNNKNDYSSNQDFMKICPHTNSSRRKPQKNLSQNISKCSRLFLGGINNVIWRIFVATIQRPLAATNISYLIFWEFLLKNKLWVTNLWRFINLKYIYIYIEREENIIIVF